MAGMSEDITINLKDNYGYKKVQIKKSQVLGVGAFGRVVKATLDALPCAAKLLHTEFFKHEDPGMKAFEAQFHTECIIMKRLKNPHIVQFLGEVMDPKEGRLILLMELMEESLTHFLEAATTPIPYCTQVNIVHDISLALDYLHSNNIVHRDLSSNNILLFNDGNHAKVTDFGMSKIVQHSARMTHIRNTQCPGTLAYMPPEALREIKPHSSEKLDTFSLGVLMIQIITRKFPEPSNPHYAEDRPSAPGGYVLVPISEVDRRKNDISKVPHNHTFQRIFRCCIKDKEEERPTASQICYIMGELKNTREYEASTAEMKGRKISSQELAASFNSEESERLKSELQKYKEVTGTLQRKQREKDAKVAKLEEENKRLAVEKAMEQQKRAREEKRKREAEAKQEKLEREMEELKWKLDKVKVTPADDYIHTEKALFEAAKKGDVVTVTRLIATGVKVDCTPNSDNRTPLMIASLRGHTETVRLLIRAKAQVNKQEKYGWTALHMAAQEGKFDAVRVLVESQADVNLQPQSGQTALYMASLNGHLPVVLLLLRRHADITICKKNGASPLYAACQEGHNDVVNALIKSGADTNMPLKEGATPLYMASHNGHSDVVKTLIRNGANPKKTFKGWRPVDIARAKHHSEVVRLLSSII